MHNHKFNHNKKAKFNYQSKFWARDKELVILVTVIVTFAIIIINATIKG